MTGTPEAAVELREVSRRFGATQALAGLSLTARTGEVTCVLGPNGAGKTTAVEIAVGLQRADSGAVRVLGEDPWGADADHRARVGVMLQDGGLPQAVTPAALLRHLARLWEDPADVVALTRTLGLSDAARTPVRRLSGGQRQRVALAAALVGRPEVAFLDEPTAGLDPHARREVHRLVAEVARDGAAVVVTTHSFDEAERLAGHVVVVVAGRVAAEGTVQEVCSRTGSSGLEDAYFALTDGALR
ncbi:ABC-type multidrug transport system, ATPase component [Serinicoccus hydrothermalis]|uniref:ABC-type multidrug transport system, ATPase component n=1 Tax=Serinicoccus hydrothermalis TaxID=1758689 RepID=A0A1B1N8A5_9MICO|nr:ABC transporter ATP-binding protein [Serinicoccus hydrothermalis]ANS77656.1 ABC-type multidrug transport system, ATPase component [Serinicoccus hydrothermalis]